MWDKINIIMQKELVYTEKYLKNKIKSLGGKINTNFHDNETPEQGSHSVCFQ